MSKMSDPPARARRLRRHGYSIDQIVERVPMSRRRVEEACERLLHTRERRLPRHLRREREDRIVARFQAGMSRGEIARELDIGNSTVIRAVARRVPAVSRARRMATGALAGSLEHQSEEFLDWLESSTPEGSSIADTLVACAVDAWREETDS